MKSILLIAGTRPNFVKIAPLLRACSPARGLRPILVHTGQHFSPEMSDFLFRDLQIPEPDYHLGIQPGSHAQVTAAVMLRLEPVLEQCRPDTVVVVGDVNSSLAGALTAKKLLLPVAHVEAGLRSLDRRMPEEINRLAIDAISDLLFTTEPAANQNLLREGVPAEKIHWVGNVMIDSLLSCRTMSERTGILERLKIQPKHYVLLTLHRPENVDYPARLAAIWAALGHIGRELPILFPVHPRTQARLTGLEPIPRLRCTEPLGYLDFLGLLAQAAVVLTDSGGIQEETTILNVPCLTLRDNTERPVTITSGTNRLAGTTTTGIVQAWRELRQQPVKMDSNVRPDKWDGLAAERIAEILSRSSLISNGGKLSEAID